MDSRYAISPTPEIKDLNYYKRSNAVLVGKITALQRERTGLKGALAKLGIAIEKLKKEIHGE